VTATNLINERSLNLGPICMRSHGPRGIGGGMLQIVNWYLPRAVGSI
jgi:hypothetical protein